jgi:hypothetical protein
MNIRDIMDNVKEALNKRVLSIVFMIVAIVLSFFPYEYAIPKRILFLFTWTESGVFRLAPSFISTLASIVLLSSVAVRNKRMMFSSTVYSITILVLDILFAASFLEFFVGGKPWSIPFLNITSQTFLIVAIVFSWIGMKSMAFYMWIILYVLAVSRMTTGNVAMGIFGVIYILCAFLSILFQATEMHELCGFSIKEDFFGN